MDSLGVTDPEARADIEKLKEEQYAQSKLIQANRECCEAVNKQLSGTLPEHNRRIGALERRHQECDTKHEAANHHRRKSDHEMSIISTTLQESLTVTRQMQATMTQLLATVEKHAPTVERSNKAHTTFDGLKSFMIYVACTSAFIIALQHIVDFFGK